MFLVISGLRRRGATTKHDVSTIRLAVSQVIGPCIVPTGLRIIAYVAVSVVYVEHLGIAILRISVIGITVVSAAVVGIAVDGIFVNGTAVAGVVVVGVAVVGVAVDVPSGAIRLVGILVHIFVT